jgi:hypothetical protein
MTECPKPAAKTSIEVFGALVFQRLVFVWDLELGIWCFRGFGIAQRFWSNLWKEEEA